MSHLILRVAVALWVILIAGCGFQLKGAADISPELRHLYIQGVNIQQDELGIALKRALKRNGIEVLEDYQQGAAVFTVLENKFQQNTLSVGSNALVTEYELEAWIVFKVTNDKGELIGKEQRVEARRDYQFDRNQLLAMSEQQRAIRDALNQQMVDSILRRLSAMK